MQIKKGNLLIRSATPCDAAILCKWWNDGKVMAHAGFPKGVSNLIIDVQKGCRNGEPCVIRHNGFVCC